MTPLEIEERARESAVSDDTTLDKDTERELADALGKDGMQVYEEAKQLLSEGNAAIQNAASVGAAILASRAKAWSEIRRRNHDNVNPESYLGGRLEIVARGKQEDSAEQVYLERYQPAFHGSPHVFEDFSLDHIGTGEGRQAHGWGLYFAQEKTVSEDYRHRLTWNQEANVFYKGQPARLLPPEQKIWFERHSNSFSSTRGMASEEYEKTIRDLVQKSVEERVQFIEDNKRNIAALEEARLLLEDMKESVPLENSRFVDKLEEEIEGFTVREFGDSLKDKEASKRLIEYITQKEEEWMQEHESFKTWLLELDPKDIKAEFLRGSLLTVDIPDNDVLLDEQKTFFEQPEAVQEAVANYFRNAFPKYRYEKAEDEGYILYRGNEEVARYEEEDEVARAVDENNAVEKESFEWRFGNLDDMTGRALYMEIASMEHSDKGASEKLNRYGIKGITYDGRTDGRCYVIFDDMAINILEREQRRDAVLQGRFSINMSGQKKIELFEHADETTFLHEMAHLLYSDMREMSFDDQVQEDLKTIHKWADWKEDQAEEYRGTPWEEEFFRRDRAIRDAIARGDASEEARLRAEWIEERFARGFERYLQKGEAPTKELGGVFSRCKRMLTNVYRAFKSLGGSPTPAVEDVMARLISPAQDRQRMEAQNAENQRTLPEKPAQEEKIRARSIPMKTAEELARESDRLFVAVATNRQRYRDYLETMAAHYKQPIGAQAALFLHAPADGRAYASEAFWKGRGLSIREEEELRGIPSLNAKGEPTLLYDVKQTDHPEVMQRYLWAYDRAKDDAHIQHLGEAMRENENGEQESVEDLVIRACRAEAEKHLGNVNKDLLAIGSAYIALSRMGLYAEKKLGLSLVVVPYARVNGEELLQATMQTAAPVLNQVATIVMEREVREREAAAHQEEQAAEAQEKRQEAKPEEEATIHAEAPEKETPPKDLPERKETEEMVSAPDSGHPDYVAGSRVRLAIHAYLTELNLGGMDIPFRTPRLDEKVQEIQEKILSQGFLREGKKTEIRAFQRELYHIVQQTFSRENPFDYALDLYERLAPLVEARMDNPENDRISAIPAKDELPSEQHEDSQEAMRLDEERLPESLGHSEIARKFYDALLHNTQGDLGTGSDLLADLSQKLNAHRHMISEEGSHLWYQNTEVADKMRRGFEDILRESEYPRDKNVMPKLVEVLYAISYDEDARKFEGIQRDMNLKEWYAKAYPSDTEILAQLSEVTLGEVLDRLGQEDEYAIMGVEDSIVRHRVLEAVAVAAGHSYDEVYDKMESFYTKEDEAQEMESLPEKTEESVETEEGDLADAEDKEGAEDNEKEELAQETEEEGRVIEVLDSSRTREEEEARILEAIDFEADFSTIRGKRAVFRRNVAAIRAMHELEDTGAAPTPAQKKLLQSYAGFGGLSEAFDPRNAGWRKEYEELKQVLSHQEYASARSSTLDAYYTPPEICGAILRGIQHLGFEHGNILEPSCGSGRFFDAMPESMRSQSNICGIEMDSLTARIVQAANPDVEISERPFQNTLYADGSFDVAIGNVPFGEVSIHGDDAYKGRSLLPHDYFFLKMLDQVREGGLVAAITSSGTMDKTSSMTREELAKKADLVLALRLPSDTFKGEGASVTTDLLVFRKKDGRELDNPAQWIESEPHGAVNTNEYFIGHFDHVLGRYELHDGRFGKELLVASDGRNLGESIERAFEKAGKREPYKPLENPLPPPVQAEEAPQKEMGYTIESGALVFTDEKGQTTETELKDKQREKIISAVTLRDAGRAVLEAQERGASDEDLREMQKRLRKIYDTHLEKYGRIHKDTELRRLFKVDMGYSFIHGFEIDNKHKDFERLANFFTERTISRIETPTFADTPADALALSMQQKGEVDLSYMAKLTEETEEAIVKELEYTHIFYDEEDKKYKEASEYLTGDIYKKIDEQDKIIWEAERYVTTQTAKIRYPGEERLFSGREWENLSPLDGRKGHDFYEAIEFEIGDLDKKDPLRLATMAKYLVEYMDENPALYPSYKFILPYQYTEELMGSPDLAKMLFFADPNFSNRIGHDFQSQRYDGGQGGMVAFFDAALYYAKAHNIPVEGVSATDPYFIVDRKEFIKSFRAQVEKEPNLMYLFAAFERENMEALDKKIKEARFAERDRTDGPIPGERKEELYRPILEEHFTKIREQAKEDFEFTRKSAWGIDNGWREEISARLKQRERAVKNREALTNVIPEKIKIGDIDFSLSATYIPQHIVKDFIHDSLNIPQGFFKPKGAQKYLPYLEIKYDPFKHDWSVKGTSRYKKRYIPTPTAGMKVFSTPEVDPLSLMEACLNGNGVSISAQKLEEGRTESEAHDAAIIKQQEVQDAFRKYIIGHPKLANEVETAYNRTFNNIRLRQYDGSNLAFPGMTNTITLKPHQKDAVAHHLYGGNTLFAHCVGAGKTFEMVASIMESKRLGLSNKAMMVVPNHLVHQTADAFVQLYGRAKVLAANSDDVDSKDKYRRFTAQVATQNFDVCIVSYSLFSRINLSPQLEANLLDTQIQELEKDFLRIDREIHPKKGKGNSMTDLEKEIRRLKNRMLTLRESKGNTDGVIPFDKMGIDKLVIDEAHYFKNLQTPSRYSGKVGGIGGSAPNQKCLDLYLKSQYMNDKTNCRGLIFATSTPVSNSMTELYVLQKYLTPDVLKEKKITNLDKWISDFAEISQEYEIKPTGKDYQLKTRLRAFKNVPEIIQQFKLFADVRTADMIPDRFVPKRNLIVDAAPASKHQKEKIDELVNRAEKISDPTREPEIVLKKNGEPTTDSMLLITREGRSLSLDPRILDPNAEDLPDSKVNRCVKNVLKKYKETEEDRGTQIIFCDESTSTGVGKGGFNVYDDIRAKLIAQGIPKEEIAIVQECDQDDVEKKIFEPMREGKIRVLIGSTDKLGVGTNVQDRLCALHDLSVPWRPADLEQREGRGIRPGNMFDTVDVFRYVTKGTFDTYMWQTLENKQKMIAQLFSKSPARTIIGMDELVLDTAEIKAIATDNRFIVDKIRLEKKITLFTIAKGQYDTTQTELIQLTKKDGPAVLKLNRGKLSALAKDKETLKENTVFDKEGKPIFYMKIGDKAFTKQSEAAKYICEHARGGRKEAAKIKGEFKGMTFYVNINEESKTPYLYLRGEKTHRFDIPEPGRDGYLISRMNSFESVLEKEMTKIKEDMAPMEKRIEDALEKLKEPFPYAEELEQAKADHAAIVAKIMAGIKPEDEEQTEEHEREEGLEDAAEEKHEEDLTPRAASKEEESPEAPKEKQEEASTPQEDDYEEEVSMAR